jgi:hypothetical protein
MDHKNESEQEKIIEFRNIRLENKMNEMSEYLVNIFEGNSKNFTNKNN